jgi:hypothetical protein
MPECVIKRVIKMGKKSRQSRSAHTFEFLNRHKEKYDWDNEELEIEEGLVEEDSYPDLLAEISGVRLESDYESDDVVEVPQITELEIAAQAARNANLAEPREGSDKFTGVNLPPPILIEDDDEDVEDRDASQASQESDGDVIFVGENAANEEPDPVQVHEVHDHEFETIDNEGAEEGVPDGQLQGGAEEGAQDGEQLGRATPKKEEDKETG